MFMLISTNLILSFSVMFMMHPLMVSLILIVQTLLVSLMTGILSPNYWFSYILFLVMVGGMLVIFMYMTSVASNEKFKPNGLLFLLMLLMILMIMYSQTEYFLPELLNNHTNFNLKMDPKIPMTKYMTTPSMWISLFLISYLLLTMIVIVKITKFKQGPIRQMN